jgi:hypothetical protein
MQTCGDGNKASQLDALAATPLPKEMKQEWTEEEQEWKKRRGGRRLSKIMIRLCKPHSERNLEENPSCAAVGLMRMKHLLVRFTVCLHGERFRKT